MFWGSPLVRQRDKLLHFFTFLYLPRSVLLVLPWLVYASISHFCPFINLYRKTSKWGISTKKLDWPSHWYLQQVLSISWSYIIYLLAPTGALIVMMCYYTSIYPHPLFQIFSQFIDAIDVTSVTLSCLNSMNAIDVKRCKLMLIESRMFQCYNVLMIQCSNFPMFEWSNIQISFSFDRVARVSSPLVH